MGILNFINENIQSIKDSWIELCEELPDNNGFWESFLVDDSEEQEYIYKEQTGVIRTVEGEILPFKTVRILNSKTKRVIYTTSTSAGGKVTVRFPRDTKFKYIMEVEIGDHVYKSYIDKRSNTINQPVIEYEPKEEIQQTTDIESEMNEMEITKVPESIIKEAEQLTEISEEEDIFVVSNKINKALRDISKWYYKVTGDNESHVINVNITDEYQVKKTPEDFNLKEREGLREYTQHTNRGLIEVIIHYFEIGKEKLLKIETCDNSIYEEIILY